MIEDNIQILRLNTAGSVDDGKSTLIGRLLYDSKSIFEDELQAIGKISQKRGYDGVDLALLTDGLKDEREQGITIDVAYRYFTTAKRKFIIADTPGHVQYTRNMITGASTSNVTIIIVDARHGVVEQTKRHSFISSLLHIPHIIICVNKMDLVDFSEQAYKSIVEQFEKFSSKLQVKDIRFIPISALLGDNVCERSENMKWYKGASLFDTLETMHISSDINKVDTRFPVQAVLRPKSKGYIDYRGYVGRLASGVLRQGDDVVVLPSGLPSKIKTISIYDKKVQEAFAPMSISITLEDDIDIGRGDIIVRQNNKPNLLQDITAMLCWLSDNSAKPRARYFIRHTTNEQMVVINEIVYKIDIKTLERSYEDPILNMNDICKVKLRVSNPLIADTYRENKVTGSFILIDDNTNETVAAGMIV